MPVRHLTLSTATGTFGPVDFGDAYRFAGFADDRTAADRDIAGTVEGSIGGSNKWTTVLTLTTNSSGTYFSSTGTDLPVFDKARVVVSANNSTNSFGAWIAAGN